MEQTQKDIRIQPAFKGNDNCIVFCADNGYVPCTSVAIRSIMEHALPERFYDIIILHSRIEQENQCLMEAMADGFDNVSIRCHDIGQITSGHRFFTENRNAFTEEAYYRLFIPWVLSDSYAKAFYLDGDMLIRHDISKVFDIDTENAIIAAVRDYWGICNCYIPGDPRRAYREEIGIKNMNDYVISGTILFNLQRFRDKYHMSDIIAMIESRKWFQHDQDVINLLCMGEIYYLSPVWGYMREYGNEVYLPEDLLVDLEAAQNNPIILHFGGARKPWVEKDFIYEDLEYWKTVDKTPFLSQFINNSLSPVHRNSLLRYLAKGEFTKCKIDQGTAYYYKHIEVAECCVEYRRIRIHGEILRLEGAVFLFCTSEKSNVEVRLKVNDELKSPLWCRKEDEYFKEQNLFMYRVEAFCFEIPINSGVREYILEITCTANDDVCIVSPPIFGRFFPFFNTYRSAYYEEDGWMLTLKDSRLDLHLCKSLNRLTHELVFLKDLVVNKRGKAIAGRIIYHLLRRFVRKPIWLVSDRVMIADDNGKAFFQYINAKHRREISSFFVISKNSSDYKKMKRYGKVLPANSWMHRIIALFASVNISTQTDEIFRVPSGYGNPSLQDIGCLAKFVFLQHGILFGDASEWLGRRNMQFDGFVTSANVEYDSIVNGAYGYNKDEVWLTGMPRFDLLEDHSEKLITIMPTWRKYLAIRQNHSTGSWTTPRDFSESKYVKFYRALLQDSELNRRATELGYKIQFRIHPSFASQENKDKFALPANVNILDNNVSYNEIYGQSALIVTDYSSSIVDFAYLRKPIIYCQFDKDEMFSGKHIWNNGYFDYESDGFGEVEYDIEGTVKRIIEYMENDCRLKDVYRDRIDRFFAYNDRNNCQRVYDHIKCLE